MILYGFLSLIGAMSLRALAHWRSGIIMMIILAAIQDPVRKLIPGTPGWLALATAPVFIALVFAAALSNRNWWRAFRMTYPSITRSLLVLVILSIPAAAMSATYGPNSWMLTLLGVFAYSVIFLGVIAGFHFPRGKYTVERLLVVYCIVHGVMLTGGLLEYFGSFADWKIIGDKVLGFSGPRHRTGYIIKMIAGFYRSGDVMGWHAAAVCCLSLVLASAKTGWRRRMWVFVSAFALAALLLCGRRKMVYMVPVFLMALVWVYWQAGRQARRMATILLVALPLGLVLALGDWLDQDSTHLRYYRETSDESFDLFRSHGFRSVLYTYDETGFFGAGLGTATPGSHHLPVARPHTWQESGPSRVLVELGVLGALGFLAAVVAIVAAMWRVTREQIKARTTQGTYAAGLIAFFIANLGSLTVSGQILADPFIASFLGLLVGVVLSFGRPVTVPVRVGHAQPRLQRTTRPIPANPVA